MPSLSKPLRSRTFWEGQALAVSAVLAATMLRQLMSQIAWACGEGDLIALQWTEVGGPAVSDPTRSGFGSRLFRAAVPDGAVHVDYRPGGLVCSVELRRGSEAA